MILIYYKLQMDHSVTSKFCRIAYFNFSSRWRSNFRVSVEAKLGNYGYLPLYSEHEVTRSIRSTQSLDLLVFS
jgi:hypothetical protein